MNVFITGITGSLGVAVVRELRKRSHDLNIFGYSRDELRQKRFLKEFPFVTLTLGDIRNKDRLLEATRGMDIIFHFAAAKHVDLLEVNPEESVDTNIDGTRNVLYAQRINKIRRVILSSTDKAAYPINMYGACKLAAERLVGRNPNNIVFRWGNVIASNGSVIPDFIKAIKDHGTVDITDTLMTRFWIRLDDAAKFIADKSFGDEGGLHIPNMKAAPVMDVAQAIAHMCGQSQISYRITGSRPGEKINECLRTSYEGGEIFSHTAPQFSKVELQDILAPVVKEFL